MPRNVKSIVFVVLFILGLYFLLTGSLIVGLILIGFAIVMPAA